VVKSGYKLVTNREVLEALTPILAPYPVDVVTYFDRDGAKSYIDVRFREVSRSFSGSAINFRAIFWNGYGGSSFGVKIGAINAFCTNGMISGQYETTYRRHTSGLDASVAREWLAKGLKDWDVVVDTWRRWQRIEIGPDQIDNAVADMTDNRQHQDKMRGVLLDKYLPKYGSTVFSLYQTLTDYASHYDDYKSKSVNSNSPHGRTLGLLVRAERVMERIAA
jgi:hypothetical protein